MSEVSEAGAQYAEMLKEYSLAVVKAREEAEADGGIDRFEYYDTTLTIYSKNGNEWVIDWG